MGSSSHLLTAIDRPRASAAIALLGLLLAMQVGCGGGTGSSSSGNFSQDIGKELSDYAVVDLASGSFQSLVTVPDLLTNPAYKTSKMVFKAVPAGSCPRGQAPSTFAAQVDEVPGTITVDRFYIGVFEVTQGQWTLIAGAASTPWTDPAAQSVAGAGSISPSKPAYGLSRDAVLSGLAATQARMTFPAALPTSDQWEYACRGGTSTVFSWGDLGSTPSATASGFAVVNETAMGLPGPQAVGSHAPNAFGLYDMLGNVWEWTSAGTGEIRGGSWHDSLAQARCANKVALDHTTAHVLAGVRLVLAP